MEPSVEVEWFDYKHGFAVKVAGNPVYASLSSASAETVADFIRTCPGLAMIFVRDPSAR